MTKNLRLKVYWNRKNGQGNVSLPKKAFEILPREVEVKIPKSLLKEKFWKGKGLK